MTWQRDPEGIGTTPEQLVEMAAEVMRLWPTGFLVRNQVGNLAVLVNGEYVGYLDFGDGTVGVGRA
jgi:hypothetical protein